MARSEAYDRHPDHTLAFDDAPAGLRVRVGETLVAETQRGLLLREGRYPAVVYVPREDVEMQHLSRNAESTHCPFKGDATYFDFQPTEDATVPSIAWSYEAPFDQMEALRDHLAFYPDRVALETFDPA